MEIRLGESIRKLRKDAGFTQEQLADALGVSVSAVHKWESGKANPELEMLVDIAEFFETSVDAMLNYGWQKLNMGQTAKQINAYKNARNVEEGIRFAEQALQKYPNSFDVVYESALLYYMSMFHHRGQHVHRTIALLEKAIELIDQKILKPIYEYLASTDSPFRIMILPDHPTPVRLRTHTSLPVPFMIYDSQKSCVGVDCFCEESAKKKGFYVENGYTLMEHLIENTKQGKE